MGMLFLFEINLRGFIVKTEIPEFLLEMSKQMNEQPILCTDHPLFQVRCKREITCAEGREWFWVLVDACQDNHEIYSTITCDSDYFFDYIRENKPNLVEAWEEDKSCDFNPYNFDIERDYYDLDQFGQIEKVPMQIIEEVVSTHFTQHDAERFIERKQHDYPKLYIYVQSAYWSPQIKQLQDWIKNLTN